MTDSIEHLDIDIDRDPEEWVPDMVWFVRRLTCPWCFRKPYDPQWTGSRWYVLWPHADDCPDLGQPMPQLWADQVKEAS